MDTELARTFLTVVEAGNFVSAAERLHVSQSTVSTRIHTLENLLGCTLFVRNKAGPHLRPPAVSFRGTRPHWSGQSPRHATISAFPKASAAHW